jgi:hypothetical protein
MSSQNEHVEPDEILPNHIEHALEQIGKSDKHNWTQVGVEMVCDGNSDHPRHAFRLKPELVFLGETDIGLQYRNVKTGEEFVDKYKK